MKKFYAAAAALSLFAATLASGSAATAHTLPAAPIKAPALAVPAAGVPAAKKAAAPKIVVGKTKTSTTNKPTRLIKKIKRATLTGSTTRNRSYFTKQVSALIAAETKVASQRSNKCKTSTTFAAWPTSTTIHKGRYASAVFSFSTKDACAKAVKNVRSFVLDLKTGKTVPLSTFADPDDLTTKFATFGGFEKSSRCVLGTKASPLKQNTGGYFQLPRPSAWGVSSKGLRVWYNAKALRTTRCGTPSTVVPWTKVATKKAMSGKIHNRIYVANYKWDRDVNGYNGDYIVTSTQGRRIAFMSGIIAYDSVYCAAGVRSGKTAYMTFNMDGGEVRFKLADNTANPRLAPSMLTGGYKLATSAQAKQVTKYMSPKNAIGICGRGL